MTGLISAAGSTSTPFINWEALGKVAAVSFIFGVAIVVIFSVGILGLSWYHGQAEASELHAVPGGSSLADGPNLAPAAGNRVVGAGIAGLCFALCAAAVLYGLWLIIPQFH